MNSFLEFSKLQSVATDSTIDLVGTSDRKIRRIGISRPGLVRRLHEATQEKVTTIVAPAGFGKSQLLREWASEVIDDRLLFISVSRPGGTVVPLLDYVGSSAIVVVDGLEDMSGASVGALATMINQSPPALRFVLASRLVPTFLDHLVEGFRPVRFGRNDLAFDRLEAELLLEAAAGPVLTSTQIDELLVRTRGWAAGLHLAVDALEGEANPAFVQEFTGAHPYVSRYVLDKVLVGQPEEVVRFLLETSVLERLSVPLCDAVTGRPDAWALLSHIRLSSMFLEPLDESGEWFGYQPLFREVLRNQLELRSAERKNELLQAAGEWCFERGDVEAAGRYFVAAGEWPRVLDIVAKHGAALARSGRAATAIELLESVPAPVRAKRREVPLQHAILQTFAGNTFAAEALVGPSMLASPLSRGESLLVDALRMSWVEQHMSPSAALSAAESVLDDVDNIPSSEMLDVFGITDREAMRSGALLARGRALWLSGFVAEGRKALGVAVAEGYETGKWIINSTGALALLEAWSGRLEKAHLLAGRAMKLADEAGLSDHSFNSNALLALGIVYRERGSLDDARRMLDRAHFAAASNGQTNALAVYAIEMALLDLAASNPRQGIRRLATFTSALHGELPPIIAARKQATRARLYVAGAELDIAEQIIDGTEYRDSAEVRAVAVELALMKRDISTARQWVNDWVDDGEIRSRLVYGLSAAAVAAIAGDRAKVRRCVADLSDIAEAEQHVRIFLDSGDNIRRVMRSVVRSQGSPYLRHVIAYDTRVGSDRAQVTLSQQELLVLRYLPSSLSNADIAARLYVSLNTVKTHLRNIYKTLGVSGRSEAVEVAAELGFV